MASKINMVLSNIDQIGTADAATNNTFIDVIGNKTDAASDAVATSSITAMIRYIVANLSTDTDVAAIIGELTTAAATGVVTDTDTMMAYIKQLVTELQVVDTNIDSILVDSNELQADWTDGGRLDLLLDGIKTVTDLLPDAGTLSSIAQEATIGTPAGADLSTDIAANQTDLDAIIVGTITNSTGADVASDVVTLDAIVDAEVVKDTASRIQTTTVTTVDGSVTPWTIAAHRLFTVTGVVKIEEIFAIVDETVVEGAGADNTCSIGIAGAVSSMIGATAGDDLVTNDIWATTTGNSIPNYTKLATDEQFIVKDTDIDLDVLGTNSITDGTLTLYCTWKPISVGATLVAAIWD